MRVEYKKHIITGKYTQRRLDRVRSVQARTYFLPASTKRNRPIWGLPVLVRETIQRHCHTFLQEAWRCTVAT
jgi:hypothetical protein